MCSQLPDAVMVAAHACCESTLCSRSCNCGELASVSAAKKPIRTLRPMQARGFMPAGDLPCEAICASVSTPPGSEHE